MGIQMNQKELMKNFVMILNWKKPIWLRCFLQIHSASQGLKPVKGIHIALK